MERKAMGRFTLAGLALAVQCLLAVNASYAQGRREWRNSGEHGLPSKVLVAKHLEIKPHEKVGEVVLLGGGADIKGEVLTLVAVGADVRLHRSARIINELVIVGGSLTQDPGARIEGDLVDVSLPLEDLAVPALALFAGGTLLATAAFITLKLLLWLVLFGACLLVLRLAPQTLQDARGYLVKTPLESLGWGALALAATPAGALLLIITLIGVLFLPIYALLLLLLAVAGYAAVAQSIGAALHKKLGWKLLDNETKALFWGIVLLGLTSLIPFAGRIIRWALVIAGLGAVIQTLLLGAAKRRKQAA